MGSTFKIFATAMALDSGLFQPQFPPRREPSDPHCRPLGARFFADAGRVLTFPEVFIYSSNIGTARMADAGVASRDTGSSWPASACLDRMRTELPEVAHIRPSRRRGARSTRLPPSFRLWRFRPTPMQTAIGSARIAERWPSSSTRPSPTRARRKRRWPMPCWSSTSRRVGRDALHVSASRSNRARRHAPIVPGYSVGKARRGTAEKVGERPLCQRQALQWVLSPLSPRMIRSMWCWSFSTSPSRNGEGKSVLRPGLNTAPVGGNINPPVGRTAWRAARFRSRQ